MIPGNPTASACGGPEPRPETLADLGEWELIRRLGAFAPAGQFADDAALLVIESGDQRTLVVNTDVLVEDLHFSDRTTTAADVGWRAAVANLSDLAAMGATEVVGITVALVAPAHTRWSWVEGVYRGMAEALHIHGGLLLGGDCSGGCQRLLAVTAIGRLPPPAGCDAEHHPAGSERGVDPNPEPGGPPGSSQARGRGRSERSPAAAASRGAIRRGDGRPGDQLLCTGPHGLSRLGLALLQAEPLQQAAAAAERGPAARPSAHPLDDGGATATAPAAAPADQQGRPGDDPDHLARRTGLDVALIQRALQAHRRPRPRFDAVQALIRCRPSGRPWRVAGCDSSDGLAAAVAAIAGASGCAAQLDRRALPVDTAMRALAQAEAWCLNGGEDFELVLALDPVWARSLQRALPGCHLIGELTGGQAGSLSWSQGGSWPTTTTGGHGFCHFS
jgi:thiamine-monophosphate kinase